MRRVIEELVEQRKSRQNELKTSLDELAGAIETLGLVKKRRPEIRAKLQQLHASLSAYITAQDKEWDAYANNHSTTVFKSLQWKIEKLEAEYSNLKTLLSHFAQLENRLDRLLDTLGDKTAAAASGELRAIKEQLSPLQYADFEQRFRGSRESIEQRLQKYLPLFAGRREILDIGCGRGEFLELLAAAGHKGLGIDLSS
ncbi:MAG: methyltransferase domain-containing protein, partial [Candidatus Aminicenantes bacterium]|nr:methyltransferase domain-containing protein [Candidatus Aminicenantes bacterium]